MASGNPPSDPRAILARRLISLTDLTSLNESDDAASVQTLSLLARRSPVRPAAVCIWPRFIPVALDALRNTGIPVCAVANFPQGAAPTSDAVAEAAAAVAAGAAEVDVVFPYRALLAGDTQAGLSLVRGCREACAERALLKVILETGQLASAEHIRLAAEIAIDGGAHFLKTSTGKTQPAATPEAAAVLLDVIAAARGRGRSIGFKASGGIRTIADATVYLTLYDERFGSGGASSGNFRIGASALFQGIADRSGVAVTTPPRIAVVGSAVTDLTTFVDAFPRPGETVFGKGFDLGFGGKGANQAVASRLCGAHVMMVAKVGDDLFGQATIDNLASFGVDTQHVRIVAGAPTGVAPILVEPDGQNRIIVVKGANEKLMPADVDAATADLERADAIILQFEIPLETVYHTVRFARSRNIRCIVNPAPAIPADFALLAGADYFIPNETEAERLSGLPVRSETEAAACASALLGKGFRRVIITLGERGSWLAAAGHSHIPSFPVTATDTTGAGDAFVGSLAVFLAEGVPEPEAVARANLYAALSTTRIGTQKSFPRRAEFDTAWALSGQRLHRLSIKT